MPYATYADIINAHEETTIIELSDDNRDGIADVGVIDAVLGQADDEIHARIATRYAVPMNPIPALAKRLAVSLAIGLLFARRSGDLPLSVKEQVQSAKKLLDRIGEGKADFGATALPASDAVHLDVRMTSQVRIFSRTRMKGF
ncbi:MAG: DUF1320 domain-containing protein [Ghiorsea sp.]|nr:DUF1320 domain-containing protein [Ghiorsea sp.]